MCLQGEELSTDPYLLSKGLSFPPPKIWVNQQSLKRRGNTLREKFKVHLLNDKKKWLYKKRMDDWFQHNEEKTDVEQEWDNKKYTTENSRRKLREEKSYT